MPVLPWESVVEGTAICVPWVERSAPVVEVEYRALPTKVVALEAALVAAL